MTHQQWFILFPWKEASILPFTWSETSFFPVPDPRLKRDAMQNLTTTSYIMPTSKKILEIPLYNNYLCILISLMAYYFDSIWRPFLCLIDTAAVTFANNLSILMYSTWRPFPCFSKPTRPLWLLRIISAYWCNSLWRLFLCFANSIWPLWFLRIILAYQCYSKSRLFLCFVKPAWPPSRRCVILAFEYNSIWRSSLCSANPIMWSW